jgi:sterol desaturase/sphingolipid hydroxylase (fatty acid hydroxylase superfamily)
MFKLLVVAGLAIGAVVEWRRPARSLLAVPGWVPRAWLFNLAQAALVILVGVAWHALWRGSALLPLPSTGLAATDGALAYLVATFVFYWWHRARHEIGFLWRTLHQFHHSASRMEVLTAFYRHPIEVLCGTLLGSVLVYTVLGASVQAGAVYALLTAWMQIFIHANVRTPHWLGWWVQRPEMHRLHHQRGHHRDNYADLPLWDWLFGTLHNPRTDVAACGFEPQQEARVRDMLVGRDVHRGAGDGTMQASNNNHES